jgi:hydrogenase small subunit
MHTDVIGELPDLEPADSREAIDAFLENNRLSRRRFMQYCGGLAALLALPPGVFTRRIAAAIASPMRVPVIWLNGQDCNGNIESFLRATKPTVSQLILDRLAINYSELLMAPAGRAAEMSRDDTMLKGGYVAIVEGSIPRAANGTYCCVGGRSYLDIVRDVTGNALATIAVGTCASHGGLPAARGGVTGAVGVRALLGPGPRVIALPGCPVNVANLTATIVQYLATHSWPATDRRDRPLFAYGSEVHERCPRLAHFENEQYVRKWGDAGHRSGWCLRYMGCQGPETNANCPTVRWDAGTSWPVKAGAVCMSCTRSGFWDVPGGFFRHRYDD